MQRFELPPPLLGSCRQSPSTVELMSHRQAKKARRQLFGEGMKQLSSTLQLCLAPNCTGQAIRAHSIQNNGALEVLSRNGKVIMPKLRVTLNELPTFTFEEVGRNVATTFTGLCSPHDQEFFRPIEVNPINLDDPEHLFLLAYRAVLKEAHATRKSAIDTQSSYFLGAKYDLYSRDTPSAPGILAVEQMVSAYLVEETKRELEVAYLSRSWGSVGHEVLHLDVPPSIAVCSMFTTDILSEKYDGPTFVMLNVFPLSGETVAVFSYLKENRTQANQAFASIFYSTGQTQQHELSKLILRRCENFAIAPSLYESYSPIQKRTISEYYERNSGGQSFESNDQNLFLFSPISGWHFK